MKVLVSPGVSLVVGQYNFPKPGKNPDAFPNHAAHFYVLGQFIADSLTAAIPAAVFGLVDGSKWYYVTESMSPGDAMDAVVAVLKYPGGVDRYPRVGEGYNRLMRPRTTGKWTDAEMATWQATH